jgi:two-component system copper resistance phosphate regulon response regulator CusR
MRVLVVEDDAKVAGAVRTGLAGEGYEVVVSSTGEDGFFRATTEAFDAILLDLGLPGRGGLEILGGLRALLRRGRPEEAFRVRVADLELDPLTRTVRRGPDEIDLTVREFELLEYLVRHQGQIVSREMLARDVWKEASRGTPLDNVIDVHITRLRKKIDVGSGPRLIHTVRGVGFVVKEGGA